MDVQPPRIYLRHRSVGKTIRVKEALESRAHDVESHQAFETLIHGREGILVCTKKLSHPRAVSSIGWGAFSKAKIEIKSLTRTEKINVSPPTLAYASYVP